MRSLVFYLLSIVTFAPLLQMAVFYSTDALPRFRSPVVTIGTFDGVHKGHQAILQQVCAFAERTGGESILLTFEPHPRKLIFPDQPIHILTPLAQKLQLVQQAGIAHVVVVPFTKDFACLTAQEYISDFLVKLFNPAAIVIGYDHHFGNDRQGNIHLLKQVQDVYGYQVVEIPAQVIEEAAVSSTKIRNAISTGHVADAAQMLGRQYTLGGIVIKGAQLGRTIGYPTANVQPADVEQIVPSNGVYAVRVAVNGKEHDAMLNIGLRPTVSSEPTRHIEAHIFGFNEDVYGAQMNICFVARLRDEQKFPSLAELKVQLGRDEAAARKALSA